MKRCWTNWLGIGVAIWMLGSWGIGTASAQSRYTLDDVMAKLIEMDKRLVRVETEIGHLKTRVDRIENVRLKELETNLLAQIKRDTTTIWTTIWALFGALIILYVTILVIVLSIYKNVRLGLQERPAVGVPKQMDWTVTLEQVLEPLRKEIREIAEREERLEKQMAMQTS